MKDETSKGLAQWPPTIKFDYDEFVERWRNLPHEEKLEAVCSYIKSVYGKTLDRMALGARMEAEGFAALVETLDILSDDETTDAIREAESEPDHEDIARWENEGGAMYLMMGRTHEMIGGAAWLGSMAALPALGQTGWAGILGGWFIAALAALGPDIDHPNSTITRILGPITRGIYKILAALGVRHRGMTHSFVAAGFVAVVYVSLCLLLAYATLGYGCCSDRLVESFANRRHRQAEG